jgi:hypothetical protein
MYFSVTVICTVDCRYCTYKAHISKRMYEIHCHLPFFLHRLYSIRTVLSGEGAAESKGEKVRGFNSLLSDISRNFIPSGLPCG